MLDETDQVVKCAPGAAYPPSSTNCTSFVPTGMQVRMHIVQGQDGRVATVTQYFSSTDGHAHALDMLEQNDFYTPSSDGELDFPWTGSGMKLYTKAGQVIPGPPTGGPGSFFVKGSAAVPDGGEASAQGAVTFSNPPASETINGTTNSGNFSWIDLHYLRTVPAAGSVALGFAYSNAFLMSEVTSYATAAARAFTPAVSIALPVSGSSATQSTATVSGTAGDANGLTSLTVDGQPVTVGGNAIWSATVPLSAGPNTITAVATNVFGNTAQATTAVTYTPPPGAPVVPILPTVVTAPTVSHASQSHRTWREKGSPGRRKPPIGTKFSFALNEPANVTLAFTRQVGGRRVKRHKCLTRTHANRHKPSCTLTLKAGTLTSTGRSGRNKVSFKGALENGHKLKPGRYTVTITATNPTTHERSKSVRLTFTIVR